MYIYVYIIIYVYNDSILANGGGPGSVTTEEYFALNLALPRPFFLRKDIYIQQTGQQGRTVHCVCKISYNSIT